MESSDLGRALRVVVVSPSDVTAERQRLAMVIDEINRSIAPRFGRRLLLWRWETDAHPGLHIEGPQGLIDAAMRIEEADVVVGIFWNRFGTPTADSASGTAHELHRAWSSWRQRGRPSVMVYFSERKTRPRNAREASQLQELLRFRESMPKEQFWWAYEKPIDFERAVRLHLIAATMAVDAIKDVPDAFSGLSREKIAGPTLGAVIATDLAIELLDPKTEQPVPEIIAPVDSSLPFTWSTTFATISADQKAASIKLLERWTGERGSVNVEDYRPLGVLEINLPPGLPVASALEVDLNIDPTGGLSLDVTVSSTSAPIPASSMNLRAPIRTLDS
jgi:hypothetical protein